MKPLKRFDEFVEDGVIVRKTPDPFRIDALRKNARRRRAFLDEISKKIELTDDNANQFVELCYDILIELLRARLAEAGFVAYGEGSHEAEVSFMREIGFSESETHLMNELRHNRNGILYHGRQHDAGYVKKMTVFLKRMYERLERKQAATTK